MFFGRKSLGMWVLVLLFFVLSCAQAAVAGVQVNIVPLPVSVVEKPGEFLLRPDTVLISDDDIRWRAEQLAQVLRPATGYAFPVKEFAQGTDCVIRLCLDESLSRLGDEGYKLIAGPGGVIISSLREKGLFNGIMTLRQLLPAEIFSSQKVEAVSWRIPCVEIEDYPRFKWRGLHLDCSRQFFDVDFIKRYIDNMAFHKLNVFHWHFTDDEGWRFEINRYPKLTELGAWRGENELLPPAHGSGSGRYGGFYTHDEIKDIVAYAAGRNISVLPEVDVPGHSRALIVSYPESLCIGIDDSKSVQGVAKNVLCAGREENFEMLDAIVAEMAGLFPFEYIHIGGDEVNQDPWSKCPRCQELMEKNGWTDTAQIQNYFVRRMEQIVRRHGRKMIGWNEILHGGQLAPDTAVMSWTGQEPGIEAAGRGHNVVMAPGPYMYFDMAQASGERGHWWAGIIDCKKAYSYDPLNIELSADKKSKIIGVQACLWSEYLDSPAGQADFMAYPRTCALSEVAWTPQGLRSWDEFNNRLGSVHLARLGYLGINYRLPLPAAVYKDGVVTIIMPFEGAEVRYTTDASEPDKDSAVYTGPFELSEPEKFRARTFIGGRSSTTVIGAERQAGAQ